MGGNELEHRQKKDEGSNMWVAWSILG